MSQSSVISQSSAAESYINSAASSAAEVTDEEEEVTITLVTPPTKRRIKIKKEGKVTAPAVTTTDAAVISQDDTRACSPVLDGGSNIPKITKFLENVAKCEFAGLSPVEQSLTEACIICKTQGITSTWSVKQMRLFITARDGGLHDEVVKNRAGDGVMSLEGLKHYEMLVTVADKASATSRNQRVALACNTRMIKPVSDLLCNMLNVEEAVLIKAMRQYDYLHYERATALYLSQVDRNELEDYFRNEFLNGYLFTEKGAELITKAKETTVTRRKPVTVASVTASAKKMSAADRKAMIAALMALDE